MIIQGRFVGDAPYIPAHVKGTIFHGSVWFLVDTGASRTTMFNRDVTLLGIGPAELQPSPVPIVGVGGSARSFALKDVEMTFASDQGDVVILHDLCVAQHDLGLMPAGEAARVLRIPSVLGRDILNRFRFICDHRNGLVLLES